MAGTSRIRRMNYKSLAKALIKTGGNVRLSSEILEISPDTAYRWIKIGWIETNGRVIKLKSILKDAREQGPTE